MRQWMGIVLLGGLLAGCQGLMPESGQPPEVIDRTAQAPGKSAVVERQIAFPAAVYAKLDKHGNATIKGRLSYTTSQGTIVGANEKVSIAPATEYSAEAAEVALAGKHIEPADPRAREYTHYAQTDGNGNFVANDIPAGVFYVAGSVRLPGGRSRSPLILKQIEIGKGQTREIDLSR